MRNLALSLAITSTLTGCHGGGYALQGEFGATQGGAQDMGLARELIAAGYVPTAEAFVVEGMFSEHDLPLAGEPCTTVLCLRAAGAIAPAADATDAAWVQVGMSSTIDPATFERPSQTIVAVVDVSSSMGWGYDEASPGELARDLLTAISDELGPNDRLAIVTFGNRVRTLLEYTAGDDTRIDAAIASLDEAGSTNMEAGLELGFELAGDAAFGTDETRVMLFTDVQPNIGATTDTEFEAMAQAAARDGIGLTVFALGAGMGQEVMLGMSHLRGGNAFSLFELEDVSALMDDSWPWMVSPIAYDLSVKLTDPPGFTLSQAHGFPTGTGAVPRAELEVSTVFLSKRRGAMLVQLSPDSTTPLTDLSVDGSLSYETPDGQTMSESLSVSTAAAELDERGHWYEQPRVGRTVGLAVLVEGMSDAAELYATDPQAAVETLTEAVHRAEADAMALNDDSLSTEAVLGATLLGLMESGAEQRAHLYGY